MAHTQQKAVVIGKSAAKTGLGLVIMARTGFQDVTINGQRFYYNEKLTYSNLGQVNIANIMAAQSNNKKGIIVISRKGR